MINLDVKTDLSKNPKEEKRKIKNKKLQMLQTYFNAFEINAQIRVYNSLHRHFRHSEKLFNLLNK